MVQEELEMEEGVSSGQANQINYTAQNDYGEYQDYGTEQDHLYDEHGKPIR